MLEYVHSLTVFDPNFMLTFTIWDFLDMCYEYYPIGMVNACKYF